MDIVSRTVVALHIAMRLPVIMWGDPGIGKTSFIRDLAARASEHLKQDWILETLIVSLRDPTALAGINVAVERDGQTQVDIAPPGWLLRLEQHNGPGILFLDELSHAPPMTQKVAYQIPLERKVGERDLPEGIAVVAAANPASSHNLNHALTPEMANRFCHLDWLFDKAMMLEGEQNGYPVVYFDFDEQDSLYQEQFLRISAQYGEFAESGPAESLHLIPSDQFTGEIRGFPTPRAWKNARRVIAFARMLDQNDNLPDGVSLKLLEERLIEGWVGRAAQRSWAAFLLYGDLPNAREVLNDPSVLDLSARTDRVSVVLNNVVELVKATADPQDWVTAVRLVAQIVELGDKALAMNAVNELVQCQPDDLDEIPDEFSTLQGLANLVDFTRQLPGSRRP